MMLGALLRHWRYIERISLRTLAQQIGIEVTALSRFERGQNVSHRQWVAIVKWILTEENKNTK